MGQFTYNNNKLNQLVNDTNMIENYITTKTVDYIIEQLQYMPPSVFKLLRLKEVVTALKSEKYYAKSDKGEVVTIWYNYDYPEDGKGFNRNIN